MPKLAPAVSVKALRLLEPGQEVSDGGCPGLRARALASGVVWSVMIVDAGVRRRVDIGHWPDIGVPEARERAAKLKAGTKIVRKTDLFTLDRIIQLYGRDRGGVRVSWPEAERNVRKVFAPMLERNDLSLQELQRTADAYPAKQSAGAAVRYIKPILKWAAKRGYAPRVDDLEQPARVQKRNRVLSDEELMKVLPVLEKTGHDGAARMMLMTACRREEVCAMRFEDIIEDVWYVPAQIRKNKREHIVPLSVDAQTVVGAQGRTSGLVFLGDKGKPLQNWNRWQEKIYARTGTEGWHRHDLRRTAATLLGKNGVAPFVIEMVLGHKHAHNDLASIYNQSRYDKEVGEALQLLSDLLSGLEIKGRSTVVTR